MDSARPSSSPTASTSATSSAPHPTGTAPPDEANASIDHARSQHPPLALPHIPPVRADSSGPLSPLPLNPEYGRREKHRHSAKAEAALELLQELAQEATLPEDMSEAGDQEEDLGKGIVHNLESRNWTYHGVTDGVRIFSREDDDADRLRDSAAERGNTKPTSISHGTNLTVDRKGKSRQGVRAHESMPYFRGEKYIEGSWKIEDVAATIRSLGARTVWDARLDTQRSALVAMLSDSDLLVHMTIKGAFPVGERDASVVTTFFEDVDEQVGYVAATSVEDPLIPRKGVRSTVHIQGFAIRSLARSPYFDAPPAKPPSPEFIPPPIAQRPAHRRAKSSVSLLNPHPALTIPTTPLPVYQPLQTVMPTLTRRTTAPHPQSATPAEAIPLPPHDAHRNLAPRKAMTHHESYGSYASTGSRDPSQNMEPHYTLSRADPVAAKEEVSTKPGLHVSFIMRASPGGNLPQTYVNQLSLNLPLGLAAFDRYLSCHGFAPYIARRRRLQGLDILEETYDNSAGRYRVTYRVQQCIANEEVRIRFWGSAFSRGRFDIEVQRADGWRLEYDVPPTVAPDERREQTGDSTRTVRRSSMSVMASPPIDTAERSFSPLQTAEPSSFTDTSDPALFPGPLGGCTLVIPNDKVETGVVTVTISKKSVGIRSQLDQTIMSGALREAARISLEGPQSESIEELLESDSGDSLARACLRNASAVLRQFELGREREKAVGRNEKGDDRERGVRFKGGARTLDGDAPPRDDGVVSTGLGLLL